MNNSKSNINLHELSEEEKQGYLTLVSNCVHPTLQPQLLEFFHSLKDYSDDDRYFSTFNYVLDYLEKEQLFFIKFFDWKQDVNDLEYFIDKAVQKHFELSLSLPNSETYGAGASISSAHVLNDFDDCLRAYGLQIGCIDTESDEYVLFVHKMEAIDCIDEAIQIIGFDYYEID